MRYVILDERLKSIEGFMCPSSEEANSVDLRACIQEEITLYPDSQMMIRTGIKVELPENSIGMLLPRSGLGCRGAVLGNLVGNIDPDYRGEIVACMWNRNFDKPIIIEPMDRIVQFVVTPVISPYLWEEEEKLNETKRGSKGFGSSGTK